MRIHDFREIGNRLYAVRKRLGLTQMEGGDAGLALRQEELFARLAACAEKDRDTALRLLEVYLKSLY